MTCGQAFLHSEWHVTRPCTNLLLPVHSHSKTSYTMLVSANKMVRSKPGETMYLLGHQGNGSLPLIWRLDRFNSANGMETDMNNKKRSHTQLDSRKQVIAFQDRVMTINIKEAQHPLKREKQVIDKSSIMLKISTKSMHRVLV